MVETEIRSAPQTGQLVRARRRQWVVDEVLTSSIQADPPGPQHLVRLRSIEEDAYGEELSVVWEIEPDVAVIERGTLPQPTEFDRPEVLDAFLDAVSWGAITSVDSHVLQAPFRSAITLQGYQLDPVARALEMPRVNLLLADDVGLGKTIQAGLVVQELLLRHRARSVLVVCPASLQRKWQDEMLEKFGLEFRIVNSEFLRELRRERGIRANPWTHFPRLIASIDWLKGPRASRTLREVLPAHPGFPTKFDILIVDEAHHISPSRSGGQGSYSTDSQNTNLIRSLAPHFTHRLFLTATPHNGYTESFTALLEMLDDQKFARGVPVDPAKLATVMVRRMKEEILDEHGNKVFPEREVLPIEVDFDDGDRAIHDLLRRYMASRTERTKGKTNAYVTEFVLSHLKRRLLSSPAAFAHSINRHIKALDQPREPKATGVIHERILKRLFGEAEAEYDDDDVIDETLDTAIAESGRAMDLPTTEERAFLSEMSRLATRAEHRVDSRGRALIRWLDEKIKPNGDWSDERVIVFTEWKDTHRWLEEILRTAGYGDRGRIAALYGGMKSEDREVVKAQFQASPDETPVRILLATDAASEGIDLQRHCRYIVHMEIPWNPSKMEQRNGRIDRFGQKASKVEFFHFVAKSLAEGAMDASAQGSIEWDYAFLYRFCEKIQEMRKDLGRVGPTLAKQVEEAMVGPRTDLDTALAERDVETARRETRVEHDVRLRVESLRKRLEDSKQALHVSPENLERVVRVGMELASQPSLQSGRNGTFLVPALRGSWESCLRGLQHPLTGRHRPVTFDHELASGRDDVVEIHLNHRLSQMSQMLLRAEIWSPHGTQKLRRVTLRTSPDDTLDGVGLIAHARLVVVGADGTRLHEQVVEAGGVVSGRTFRRVGTERVRELLASAGDRSPDESSVRFLSENWEALQAQLNGALDRRQRERAEFIQRRIEGQRDSEIQQMESTLDELERDIRSSLGSVDAQRQLPLWTDIEHEQLRRNVDALNRRLLAIPEERSSHVDQIRKRYAKTETHLLPVAVTVLVAGG